MKDGMIKEAVMDALTNNKIIFRINENSEGYQQLLIENGILVVQCKHDRFWTNIGNITSVKLETIIPSDGLPMTLKKNIRDSAKKLDENLNRIEKASGKVFTFETDYADVYEKADKSYKDRVGEILQDSYLSNIASLYVYFYSIFFLIFFLFFLFFCFFLIFYILFLLFILLLILIVLLLNFIFYFYFYFYFFFLNFIIYYYYLFKKILIYIIDLKV